jgi:tetratricopeptide (TPR) repeat protein
LVLAVLVRAVSEGAQPPVQAPPGPAGGSARKPPTTPTKPPPSAEAAAIERRLSEAVHRNPDSFAAHYQLASFYLQQKKLQAALPHLGRARAIDPTNYDCGHDLALALLELGKLDDARALIVQMIGAKESAELYDLLGNVEERAGNFAKADEPYERASHMAPTEGHLFDWGNNLLQLGEYEEATQVFGAAIVRHPQSARLHVGAGIAQYSRGQYEDAVKSFCQAADLAPSDPRPYQFLGEMYGVAPALGAEITKRLAGFAKTQPKNALAQFYYAMDLWKGQPSASQPVDMRRIEALLRQAVTLDRKFAKGFLELGILLSDARRYREAIFELQRATQLEPDLAQAHYRLAQAYQRTGQAALAAKEFEAFERLRRARGSGN